MTAPSRISSGVCISTSSGRVRVTVVMVSTTLNAMHSQAALATWRRRSL